MDIALFGGTFDPVHNAHMAVARAARDQFGFARVLMIPAAVQPHKVHRTTEDWIHRYRMVALACAGEDRVEASDLERGTVRSYTIDTIHRLREKIFPSPRLFFVIGADAFAELPTWHRATELMSEVEFVVVTRPGHGYETPPGARVHPLDSVWMSVSSSHIRERLALCEAPEELPPRVFEYIKEHRLYGYGSACAAAAER